MALQHLHLHVSSLATAQTFYSTWFSMRVTRSLDDLTFMTDERDFLLALAHDQAAAPLPSWFHFGMRMPSRSAVIALHDRMLNASIALCRPLYQDESLVSYRCNDPDGHVIEVYWEYD